MSKNGWSLDTGPLFDYLLLRVEAIRRRKSVDKVTPSSAVVQLLKSLRGPDTRRAFEDLLRTRRQLYAASGVAVELVRIARDRGQWSEEYARCMREVFRRWQTYVRSLSA